MTEAFNLPHSFLRGIERVRFNVSSRKVHTLWAFAIPVKVRVALWIRLDTADYPSAWTVVPVAILVVIEVRVAFCETQKSEDFSGRPDRNNFVGVVRSAIFGVADKVPGVIEVECVTARDLAAIGRVHPQRGCSFDGLDSILSALPLVSSCNRRHTSTRLQAADIAKSKCSRNSAHAVYLANGRVLFWHHFIDGDERDVGRVASAMRLWAASRAQCAAQTLCCSLCWRNRALLRVVLP